MREVDRVCSHCNGIYPYHIQLMCGGSFAPAPQAGAEPCAWLYSPTNGDDDFASTSRPEPDDAYYTHHPLYTHPPTPAPSVVRVAEELERLALDPDNYLCARFRALAKELRGDS